MEIDLSGQAAVVVAEGGSFVGPVEAALSRCGAKVALLDPAESRSLAIRESVLSPAGGLGVLVFVSPTFAERQLKGASTEASLAASADTLDSLVEAASDALAAAQGRIVVLGSVLGFLPARRHPKSGLADAALFALLREIAMRLGPRKVRVNGLALGAIDGAAGPPLAGDETLLAHAAVRRPGTLEDVANGVLFLADPANTYMTGHILTVDGGFNAGFARDF